MEIIFKGRQTDVPARFREHATAKLERLEKLDQKAIRVDVEVSVERNPRQASQKERVELTIRSRGPAIRAEAAAEDRFAALDLALGKLDSRLRRALDRRKNHHGGLDRREADRLTLPEGVTLPEQTPAGASGGRVAAPAGVGIEASMPQAAGSAAAGSAVAGTVGESAPDFRAARPGSAQTSQSDSVVPIEMEGDGPLVVRQKFHHADPISIDQALLEMELVGHDFYLFHDIDQDTPSVVYRRRGYQYGVIRLVEQPAGHSPPEGMASEAARGASVPGRRRPERSGRDEGELGGQTMNATVLQSS